MIEGKNDFCLSPDCSDILFCLCKNFLLITKFSSKKDIALRQAQDKLEAGQVLNVKEDLPAPKKLLQTIRILFQKTIPTGIIFIRNQISRVEMMANCNRQTIRSIEIFCRKFFYF